MDIINERSALARTRRAIARGSLNVGILGGSITAGDVNTGGMESNWPYYIRGWLLSNFTSLRLTVCNGGIGGTGTLCGLMRCEKEMIAAGCDIVFLEYAVNDCYGDAELRTREREGLIRKLLRSGCDVVLVYTFRRDMHAVMAAGGVPDVVLQFEELAKHYSLSSVWSGRYALDQLNKGRISWEGWLPIEGDNIHPGYAGSSIYAEPVIELLRRSLEGCMPESGDAEKTELPAPLDARNYETMRAVPMESWDIRSPWTIMRELKAPWYDRVAYTCADGAELSFRFSGRVLAAMLNFGKRCGVFTYSIDGGDWKEMPVDRAYWVPDNDWCTPVLLESDLPAGEHTFRMKTQFKDIADCKGSECKIYTFMCAD